ncbi:hypothetical protein [Tardisphaera saccharovorans]
MKAIHVYLPDHVRQAVGGNGNLTEALKAILEEVADSGDSSCLPQEKRLLSEASAK